MASRPSSDSQTNERNREVRTEKLSIKARLLSDGKVKAKTETDTSEDRSNLFVRSNCRYRTG